MFSISLAGAGKKTNPVENAKVTFALSPLEVCEANTRACSVTVPLGFGFRPSKVFTNQKMKSHDWIQVMALFYITLLNLQTLLLLLNK